MPSAKKLILNVLAWAFCLYVVILLNAYVGTFVGIVVPSGFLAIAAIVSYFRRRHAKSEIATIEEADNRPIRFDGRAAQLRVASEIGTRLGWNVETDLDGAGKTGSVRFTAGPGSSSPKDLLQALFDAGIAWSVKP